MQNMNQYLLLKEIVIPADLADLSSPFFTRHLYSAAASDAELPMVMLVSSSLSSFSPFLYHSKESGLCMFVLHVNVTLSPFSTGYFVDTLTDTAIMKYE